MGNISNVTIGNITIPIKEKEIDTSLGGSTTFLEESNRIYVESGVSLNNENVLKLIYEPVTDTINLGWVKKVNQNADHTETDPEILPVKIARWSKGGENDVNTLLESHIADKVSHISTEENIALSQSVGLFDLISIKYGEPEVETLSLNPTKNISTTPIRHFSLEPNESFSFNIVRLKKPSSNQNLGFPVFLKVISLTGTHEDEEGEFMGVSANSINIISTTSSDDYFEWSFSQTIEVSAGQTIMFSFIKDAKILKEHEPIFISVRVGDELDPHIGTCIRCRDIETVLEQTSVIVEDGQTFDTRTVSYTPNDKIDYAPFCSFVLQDANYIYFK